MNCALSFLLVVLAFSFHAVAQASKGPAQPSATVKKHAQTRTLSVAEVHDLARRVSVEISERTQVPPGYRHLGSGVWLAEGLVATCWHVVNGVKGPIKVSLGTGGVVTVGGVVFHGVFSDYASTVVASDPASDIAILRTDENPFKATGGLIRTPTGTVKPKLGVARVNENIPPAGTLTVLSGYPLQGSDLVSQTGNVAGTGDPEANGVPEGGVKSIRILVSLVSNPGNSGGPVFDDHGDLIGLLEGNLPSLVKDETPTYAVYLRPRKDADGNILVDAHGKPILMDADGTLRVDVVNMSQNSGISVVVPARLITSLLKQAQEKK
jgi:S1-C subfamily serine protease